MLENVSLKPLQRYSHYYDSCCPATVTPQTRLLNTLHKQASSKLGLLSARLRLGEDHSQHEIQTAVFLFSIHPFVIQQPRTHFSREHHFTNE